MLADLIMSFTGTRRGMTDAQKTGVRHLFNTLPISRVVHGDCKGADADCHVIAQELGVPVVLRPCNLQNQRAFCTEAELVHPPGPPLERNKSIVMDGELLVATPGEYQEELRSGTWATVRYARKSERRVVIVWPDGRIEE